MAEDSILKDPEYRASIAKLEEAIAEHHKIVERIGNEKFSDAGTESAVVFGWVLGIGIMGIDEDGDEFSDVLVETNRSLNNFTAIGVARYAAGFLEEQSNNYRSCDHD